MTQSPTISRTACICCVAACTQWNFKLKKKNKNQIMKFYMQGDVKSCSHFGKKNLGVPQTTKRSHHSETEHTDGD